MSDKEDQNAAYEHKLRVYENKWKRWEKNQESILHLDNLAGQIGLFALKSFITVNGAALIAIFAAYPNLKDEAGFAMALPEAGKEYMFGLIAGLLSGSIAYIRQMQNTNAGKNEMYKIFYSEEKPPFPKASRNVNILFGPMILSAIVSLVLFYMGCQTLLGAFPSS